MSGCWLDLQPLKVPDMNVLLDPNKIEDYRLFLKLKTIPRSKITGHMATFPDEYASLIGTEPVIETATDYRPIKGLFDYQEAVSKLAIWKKKFAVFMKCGRGKTLVLLEYARHVARVLPRWKRILIIAPLMVVKQTIREAMKWYGKALPLWKLAAKDLPEWIAGKGTTHRIGITNYEAITDDLVQGCIGCLILDESAMLKSHYGKWGTTCIRLGRGLEFKLALTGMPAPNDRIEYANHAVFLDAFPTVNSFLARYFVNKGQTQDRWILRPHALQAFYRDLSHWSIFLENPATYGWKDNCDTIPPIIVHIHDVALTQAQSDAVYKLTGKLFMDEPGGITKRAALSRIGKGDHNGQKIETLKFDFIKGLVDSWPDESTIIWCKFNSEQEMVAKMFPNGANISGDTPVEERETLIDDFTEGRRTQLISKGRIIGFGMNLQRATRHIFSGLQDSLEEFHQCVHRSNRIGSTLPLNVHIPVSEIERPMVENVLRKAARVQADVEEQERFFKDNRIEGI